MKRKKMMIKQRKQKEMAAKNLVVQTEQMVINQVQKKEDSVWDKKELMQLQDQDLHLQQMNKVNFKKYLMI